MFGFTRKPLRLNQPSSQSAWHKSQRHLDTVVFVHGILGSHETTWGNFQALLDSDLDLPCLDIWSWGYRSGFVPGSYQDVETEGDALISDMDSSIQDGNDIYLVGHSMGGLVILKGLVDRITQQHGRRHPVKGIKQIVLFASPLHGSAVANVVSFALRLSRWLRWLLPLLPYNQLRNLRTGEFCNRLMAEVVNLVYTPRADDPLVCGPIPVRACSGKHDKLVPRDSAVGVFRNPAPKHLEADHGTIKLPDHHLDTRYLALKNDLESGLAVSFHELCRIAVDRNQDPAQRRWAAERLDNRYGEMIRRCASHCFRGRYITDADLFEVGLIVWQAGALGPAAKPAQIMARVIRDYRYKDDPRLAVR